MKSLLNYREIQNTIEEFQVFSGNNRYPSPAHLLHYILGHDSAIHFDDICRHFGHSENDDIPSIRERLDLLETVGLLVQNRKDEFLIPSSHVLADALVSVNLDGEGSVIIPAQNNKVISLTKAQLRRVIHGDRVICLLITQKRKNLLQAHVLGVLNRSVNSVVGKLKVDSGGCRIIVQPLSKRFPNYVAIKYELQNTALINGDIVKVVFTSVPFAKGRFSGKVVEILGQQMDPNLRTIMVLNKFDIPYLWPQDVINESSSIQSNQKTPTIGATRKDLRDIPFITIDGCDARDFDDAVYCSEESYGWRLVVAIADVSHYVKTGSALDLEAYRRGTSVYFPDRVVPMFPEVLSNVVCSLNPHEERNSLVCDIRIDHHGQISEYEFYQAVIKSHARMTYEAVEAFLSSHEDKNMIKSDQLEISINNLKSVTTILESNRIDNGSITFEFPVSRIDVDQEGQIKTIVATERLHSHKIIEECMLVANRCAAEFIHCRYRNRALYRVHSGPSPEDIIVLRQHLQAFGVFLEGGKKPNPTDFQKLLGSVIDSSGLRDAVQILLLQCMGRAFYASELSDHFALGFTHYTHFTSPIRRYGDLVIHRLIKSQIKLPGYKKAFSSCMSLDETSSQCSMAERRADAAVYDAIAWYKALYMLQRIGKRFSGVVTGVKDFGLFIRLDELLIDGLAHISRLGPDYYRFDGTSQTLTGDISGEIFRLGDRVEVQVSDVDLTESRVNFSIDQNE